MDQAPRVRGRDAARQTLDQPRRAFRGQGSAVQPLLQAPSLKVFQLQVGQPANLAEGVDLDHVRMLQLSDGLGFILKPLSRRGVGVRAGQDHLQRANAVEPDLPGLVNDAHPATAEFAQNFITGNGRRDPRPPVEPRSSRRGRAPVVVQRLRRMIRGGRPAVHRCGRVVVDLVIGERQGRGKDIPLRERRRRRIKNHVAGALGLGLRGPILRAERIVRLCLAQFKPIAAVHSSPLPRSGIVNRAVPKNRGVPGGQRRGPRGQPHSRAVRTHRRGPRAENHCPTVDPQGQSVSACRAGPPGPSPVVPRSFPRRQIQRPRRPP